MPDDTRYPMPEGSRDADTNTRLQTFLREAEQLDLQKRRGSSLATYPAMSGSLPEPSPTSPIKSGQAVRPVTAVDVAAAVKAKLEMRRQQNRLLQQEELRQRGSWRRETPKQLRERCIRQLRAELTTQGPAPRDPVEKEDEAGAGFFIGHFGSSCGLGSSKVSDHARVNYNVDENPERGNWSGRLDFLFSCLGYAVGLGNVWRFPYLCFANGGGAFLVPYVIFLLLCGIPVFLLDLSLGQFTSAGPSTCWELAPLFSGVGYAMIFVSGILATYYNMIMALSCYYFFASMPQVPPWSFCNNSWNTEHCLYRLSPTLCSPSQQKPNGTCYNGTKLLGVYNDSLFRQQNGKRVLPADEYFNNEVLKLSSDISAFGLPDWKLTLCLLLSWIFIFACMLNGIKTTGKVTYFTALFPYLVLVILFCRGVTLSNAIKGIKFYIVPDFSKLRDAKVWRDAAGQIFYSLSCSFGGLISLSSYNRFHNNVIRDTFFVTLANCGTSVFAGFVIFSFIGHLAESMDAEMHEVSSQGFGLIFIVYPEALKLLSGGNYWSMLFFFFVITLGLDSQFGTVETLITSLSDRFRYFRHHKALLTGTLCATLFLLGLPLTCNGGLHLLTVIDSYICSWSMILIAFIECILVGWVYGRPGFGRFHRFSEDIALMTREPISPVWRYLWQYVTPTMLLLMTFSSWVQYQRSLYSGTHKPMPVWVDIFGWLLASVPVLIIVGTGFHKLLLEPPTRSWRRRLFDLSIPSYKWGPVLPKYRLLMAPYIEELGVLKHFYLDPKRLIKFIDVFPLDETANKNRNAVDLPAEPSLSLEEATEASDEQAD